VGTFDSYAERFNLLALVESQQRCLGVAWGQVDVPLPGSKIGEANGR